MSAHGETRRRAFEAACTLAAEGKRPTLLAIRDRLDGRGGAQAIADGLNDWIDEAGKRFAIPGVPEELRAQV
ncbi:MAG TPA: DNA-binding protein, partial [Lamprocystis sp. (in: g-proteobacteria)]|nr:DNA-binding protein [Lamprocystis sp. (in: g-proteobacteria)]